MTRNEYIAAYAAQFRAHRNADYEVCVFEGVGLADKLEVLGCAPWGTPEGRPVLADGGAVQRHPS